MSGLNCSYNRCEQCGQSDHFAKWYKDNLRNCSMCNSLCCIKNNTPDDGDDPNVPFLQEYTKRFGCLRNDGICHLCKKKLERLDNSISWSDSDSE